MMLRQRRVGAAFDVRRHQLWLSPVRLAARPSRDLRVAAHQQITAEWWDSRRHEFLLFVSQLVVEEASAGDPTVASRRVGELLEE